MIFLNATGHQLVILEPNELEHLQKGGTITTPDNRISLMFTPDAPFMAELIEQAQKGRVLTAGSIDVIHSQSLGRKPVRVLHAEPIQIVKENAVDDAPTPAQQN